LRFVAERNDCLTRLNELLLCVPSPNDTDLRCLDAGPKYLNHADTDWCLYLTSRLMQLRDRAVQGILNDDARRALFCDPSQRRAARILVDAFGHWEGSVQETLDNFYVYFRLRRLFHLSYTIKTHLCDDPQALENNVLRDQYRGLWRTVNHRIKLMEILQATMEDWIDRSSIEWQSLHDRFVDQQTGDKREPTVRELREVALEKWDKPLQFASGVSTRDYINVVRMSPADAQRGRSQRPLQNKVCGKALGAFGGFFKKPWRSNDIM
jgi:hypothetical protein